MPPFSLSTVTAGIIAPLVGFAGTVALSKYLIRGDIIE